MDRREFLGLMGAAPLAGRVKAGPFRRGRGREVRMRLFLAGDVMTGRGIDQVLRHPVDPRLHESYVKTARRYVALAETEHGEIPAPVGWSYVWGDALEELERMAPAARVINLETSVTTSDDWLRTKGIHYRMHPENVAVLEAMGVDVCVLGNNHVLDWGRAGLLETLETLADHGMAVAGAGRNLDRAEEPAVVETAEGRLLVFSWGTPSAGIPGSWAAGPREPGVNVLPTGRGVGRQRGPGGGVPPCAGGPCGDLDPLGRQLGL